MKKILIVVPHYDDEVLGFGGSIIKHVESGNHVHVCFLRKPYDERSALQYQQSYVAKEILGYQQLTNLDLSEEELCTFQLSALKKLEACICEEKPDILYLPHADDVHQEHEFAIKLARVATRIWGPNKTPLILSGEIISSSGNAFGTKFNPQCYEVLSPEHVALKQQALLVYTNETQEWPHPRSAEGIEIYANKRGMEAGAQYAEAFEVLRFVRQ